MHSLLRRQRILYEPLGITIQNPPSNLHYFDLRKNILRYDK